MVKEGIVLGHKISKNGIEVDKAKVNVIAKLPHPTDRQGLQSFLCPADSTDKKLTEAPILIVPDWDLPFELMCDASDFAIGSSSVLQAKKLLTSSQLAIVDPPGDITAPTTPPKTFLPQDFIGLLFIKMPMTWSPDVTLVSVKEKFRNMMKCLKIPSKFAKSLTCRASIS
ncbi:hypothetical protein Tco_0655440 [Tanacetum coccineum]|uniref:Reverse transcriptase/retrotransposon-derived protein RNase H-like domain-containing protein n=1 Tax=Tanacetum coccineum TaxID=301880 RepID=A0ABQ4X618_9ASTR